MVKAMNLQPKLPTKKPGEIALLSYNLLGGTAGEKIVAELESLPEKPDLLCFQEFPTASGFGQKLSAWLGLDFHHHQKTLWDIPAGALGLATFFNARLFDWRETFTIPLPPTRTVFWERLLLAASLHSASLARAALVTRLTHDRKEMLLVNAHLSWEGRAGDKLRQLEAILAHPKVASFAGPILLGGDFNILAGSLGGWRLRKRLEKSGFADLSQGIRQTYDFFSPLALTEDRTLPFKRAVQFCLKFSPVKIGIKIDYVFGRKAAGSFAAALPFTGSDHLPLLVHIRL